MVLLCLFVCVRVYYMFGIVFGVIKLAELWADLIWQFDCGLLNGLIQLLFVWLCVRQFVADNLSFVIIITVYVSALCTWYMPYKRRSAAGE